MRQLSLLGGFLVALASLAVACGGPPKLARVPKTPDIIIKADEAYLEGEEQERDLSLKHYNSMENIIAETRNIFPVQQFEFFERQVGFFPPPKEKNGSFLGLGAYTEETLDTSTTNRNKRVASMFAIYGKPLLEIMTAQEEIMEDSRVAGIKLYLTYWKKNKAKELYGKGRTEWVEFFLKKEDAQNYLSRTITDQDLLDNNYVFMESGRVKIIMGEAM
jgi:hypothetical protein